MDPWRAAEYFKTAARQGDARAQAAYGRCLELGVEGDGDSLTWVDWYRLSAEQGDADGQYNLARCLDRGIGVRRDLVAAETYYRLAMEQGYAPQGVLAKDRWNEAPVTPTDRVFERKGGHVRVLADCVIIPGASFCECSVGSVEFEADCRLGMIAEYAFYGTRIKAIEIPSSVEVLGVGSFANCSGLRVLEFEAISHLKIICEEGFWGTGIRTVSIPESVRQIGEWSFACCRSLMSVHFGYRRVLVGDTAFELTPYQKWSAGVAFISDPSETSICSMSFNWDRPHWSPRYWDKGRLVSTFGFLRRSTSAWSLMDLETALQREAGAGERSRCESAVMRAIGLSKQGRHQESYRMYMTAMCGFAETRFSGALTLLVRTAIGAFSEIGVISKRTVERFYCLASMVRSHQVWSIGKYAAAEVTDLVKVETDLLKVVEMRKEGVFLRLLVEWWRSFNGISEDIRGEIAAFNSNRNGS
jgi:hypothetical protein